MPYICTIITYFFTKLRKSNNMATRKLHYSFIPGLNKIKAGETKRIRLELKEILGIKTDRDYYQKRKVYVNIPAHYKKWVEELFLSHGIEKQDVWEITDDEGNIIDF